MYQSSCSRPTSTTRVVEMMPWWRRWGWSVRHQKRTVHIIFIGATSALCFHQKYATINQSINIFIANSQLSIIIYYTAKNRAPNFYAVLLQMLCWEPGGLPSFKVSGDPWAVWKSNICELVTCIELFHWLNECKQFMTSSFKFPWYHI